MALPNPSLLSLPAELRNTIYDQVFDSDISNADMLALMKTSKQLHLEAGSHFYAKNPFTVSIPGPAVRGATILPPINDRYLPYLKDLGVDLHAGCAARPRVQDTAAAIKRLASISAAFDKLSFMIQFPPELSSFLQSRYDDRILDKSHPITLALRHVLDSGVSKTVHIWMNGAWFAPGLATEMKARYGSGLEFMLVNDEYKIVPLGDLAGYEKALMGRCSCTPFKIFGHADEGSDDLNTASGVGLGLVEPVLDLDETEREAFLERDGDIALDLDEDTDVKNEEDLTDEDDVDVDVDMEDLVPLDPAEVDAIIDNMNDISDLLIEEDMVTKEVEFLVAMAPHMLVPSSEDAGTVAAAYLVGPVAG